MENLLRPYIESGEPLPFGQLSMEIHLWDKSFESFLGWWEVLEEAGLRPFWTEPNLVYQIYNKKGTPDLAEVCRCVFWLLFFSVQFFFSLVFVLECQRKQCLHQGSDTGS